MKMYRSIRTTLLMVLPAAMLMTSCGDDSQPAVADDSMFDVEPVSPEQAKEEQERLERTKKIFYNIPSPMETASLLKKAGQRGYLLRANKQIKIFEVLKSTSRCFFYFLLTLNLDVDLTSF